MTATDANTADKYARRPPKHILVLTRTVVFIIVFNWSYINRIAPAFSYLGFTYAPTSLSLAIGSCTLAALLSLFLPKQLSRPSQVVYLILYFLVVIPIFVVVPLSGQFEDSTSAVLLFSVGGAFSLLGLMYRLPLAKVQVPRLPQHMFWLGVTMFSTLAILLVGLRFGFQLNSVGFSEVYDVRADYKDEIEASGSFVSYLIGWQGNVVGPLLVGLAIVKKRPSLFAAGAVSQIFLYSITGFKSLLLSTIVLATVGFLAHRRVVHRLPLLAPLFLTMLIAASSLLDWLLRTSTWTSLAVRRLLATAGLNSGYYWEYFSDHGYTYLGQSILSWLVEYPFTSSPPQLIGEEYYPGSATSANANLWADAFANFGVLGVLVFTVILGLILWLYDSATAGRDVRVPLLLPS
jgi:hypothetical protein